MNEVIRTILERRSIRKYSGQPVKREDIELVLQLVFTHPPAGIRSRGISAC